jgi:hypothetical protein
MIPADSINGPQVVFIPQGQCGGNTMIDGYMCGWVIGALIAYFTWSSVLKDR